MNERPLLTTDEYAAVRSPSSAGLINLSKRGRIFVSGGDAVQFLNGFITNDIKTLAPASWFEAAFPNVQGKLLCAARILNIDHKFLLDTEAVTHDKLFNLLKRFALAGDFQVEDVTVSTALISIQGAGAADITSRVLGDTTHESIHAIGHGRVHRARFEEKEVTVIRATHTAEDGFDLLITTEHVSSLWNAFVNSGARPIGEDVINILRIEAGLPRYGNDIDETHNVLEAGLDAGVSYTKGCYTGQEIIARIHWRGHVAKKLAGLLMTEHVELASGARVKSAEGREIGRITSATYSPILKQTIALSIIKYDFLAPGTRVIVVSENSELAMLTATVTELPFVPGSWRPTHATQTMTT